MKRSKRRPKHPNGAPEPVSPECAPQSVGTPAAARARPPQSLCLLLRRQSPLRKQKLKTSPQRRHVRPTTRFFRPQLSRRKRHRYHSRTPQVIPEERKMESRMSLRVNRCPLLRNYPLQMRRRWPHRRLSRKSPRLSTPLEWYPLHRLLPVPYPLPRLRRLRKRNGKRANSAMTARAIDSPRGIYRRQWEEVVRCK